MFSILPRAAVLDRRLKAQDLQVLALLGISIDTRTGWCTRSQVKMAREIGCGRATLQRSLSRLVEVGYVEQRPLVRADGGDRAHEYRVLFDEVRPAAFINDIDEFAAEAGGDGPSDALDSGSDEAENQAAPPCPPAGTPAHQWAPLPTLGGQGVPTHERAPIRTTFLKRDSEREARTRDPVIGRAGDRLAVSIAEETAAARGDPAFMAFIDGWDGAAADDLLKPWRAWQLLEPEERAAASDRAAAYQAYRRVEGRKKMIAAATYLGQKLWLMRQGEGEGGTAGDPFVAVPAMSRAFWALVHRRIAAGQNVMATIRQALDGRPIGVRVSEAPTAAEEAALFRLETSGPQAEAWFDHFREQRICTIWAADIRARDVWMPAERPPGWIDAEEDLRAFGEAG